MRSSSYSPVDPFHDLRGLASIHPLEILVEDPLGVLEHHYGDGSIPRGGVPPVAVSLVKVSPNGDTTTESFLGRTKVLHFVNGRAVSSLQSADQARILYEHAVTAIARLRVEQNPSYKGQPSGSAIKAELTKLIAESAQDQTFYLMVAHLDGSTPIVVDIFWRKNILSSWQSIWCTMSDDGVEVRPELEGCAEQLTENQAATLQLWFKIFLAEIDRRNPDLFDLREGQGPINISTTNR